MLIPDNVLKKKLQNVYFIWGGCCAGKTTSANELQRKHGYYWYSTDYNRTKHFNNAVPEYQPEMCKRIDPFTVSKEEALKWEVEIVREFTPMVVADLIELAVKHEIVICESDIDIDLIMPIVTNAVCLSYWGNVPRDFYSRPDHANILDSIRNSPDFSESEKQERIKNAYEIVGGNNIKMEHKTPREVIEYGIKHIVTDETTSVEQMVNMIEDYFGFPRNSTV